MRRRAVLLGALLTFGCVSTAPSGGDAGTADGSRPRDGSGPVGDPSAPRVSATVTVNAAVDLTRWSTVATSFVPVQPDEWRTPVSYARPLEPGTFPMAYDNIPGIGVSQSTEWRLSAWLTNEPEPGLRPAPGEPFAEVVLDYGDCPWSEPSMPVGCGSIRGVTLEILPPPP